MLKKLLFRILLKLGYEARDIPSDKLIAQKFRIPDFELYQPLFSPWLGIEPFTAFYRIAQPRTLVSADRCYVLYCLVRQALLADGQLMECGVYRGGTAAMLAAVLRDASSQKKLHLFDTFKGMPETDSKRDIHRAGDFNDTSLEAVREFIGDPDHCVFHPGFIPDTFESLEDLRFCFAHIDVDIYKSIIDCLEFLWPRLVPGGVVVFDDYGFATCPGARQAVDEFFRMRKEVPLCLPTGQALVFKAQTASHSPA